MEGKGISDRERTEIESVIGMGFDQRLDQFAPACLAIWKKKYPTLPFGQFQTAWKANTKTPEAAGEWLGIPEIGTLVDQASRVEEPQGSLLFLQRESVSVAEWQEARRQLGEDPFVFLPSIAAYEQATAVLASRIMALVAYSAVPAASSKPPTAPSLDVLADAKSWVEGIAAQPVPDLVKHRRLDESEVISRVLEDALEADCVSVLQQRLPGVVDAVKQLAGNVPTRIGLIELKREPARAALVYQYDSIESRVAQATSDAKVVLKVAVALAPLCGERVEERKISSNELVALLRDGWWANRILVLAALRYALEIHAPNTAARMKAERAFRDIDDWQSLWRKFSELGDPPKPEAPPPAKPRFSLLGHSMTEEDFLREASNGSEGLIAKTVADAVVEGLDIAGLRDRNRGQVDPLSRKRRRRRRGAGAPTPPSENELTMLGAIGERFIYQQFRAILPNFNAHNWLSKNRKHFGYATGDDSLGYDFEYRDSGGILTGRNDAPMCRIEVKSTTGDGTNAFEMTTNEWDVAYECHNSDGDEVYIVVRVGSVAKRPTLADILVDPVGLRQQGVLDYSSRNLLVVVGDVVQKEPGD